MVGEEDTPPELDEATTPEEFDPVLAKELVRSSSAALPLCPAVAILIASSSLEAQSASPFSSSRCTVIALLRRTVVPAKTSAIDPARERVCATEITDAWFRNGGRVGDGFWYGGGSDSC